MGIELIKEVGKITKELDWIILCPREVDDDLRRVLSTWSQSRINQRASVVFEEDAHINHPHQSIYVTSTSLSTYSPPDDAHVINSFKCREDIDKILSLISANKEHEVDSNECSDEDGNDVNGDYEESTLSFTRKLAIIESLVALISPLHNPSICDIKTFKTVFPSVLSRLSTALTYCHFEWKWGKATVIFLVDKIAIDGMNVFPHTSSSGFIHISSKEISLGSTECLTTKYIFEDHSTLKRQRMKLCDLAVASYFLHEPPSTPYLTKELVTRYYLLILNKTICPIFQSLNHLSNFVEARSWMENILCEV